MGDNYYKYQVYAPNHEGADSLGYVHFESKEAVEDFTKLTKGK